MTLRDVFLEYIPDDSELEQFAAWAFGTGYEELDQAMVFLKAWNDRHGEKLTLEPTGQVTEDVPKMVQLWKNNK